MTMARKASAEALGTMLLVATVVGSGVMAERLTDTNGALTLLCNTLPTGAILTVLILALAPISGAHFNPAVTIAFAMRGDLEKRAIGPYVLAQVVGALCGVSVANWLFALPVMELSTQYRGGIQLVASEILATFGLMLAIVATLRLGTGAVAASVGLYISAAYWFTPSTSFANPRRHPRPGLLRILLLELHRPAFPSLWRLS